MASYFYKSQARFTSSKQVYKKHQSRFKNTKNDLHVLKVLTRFVSQSKHSTKTRQTVLKVGLSVLYTKEHALQVTWFTK